jgi:methionyl-tRNA synthetase
LIARVIHLINLYEISVDEHLPSEYEKVFTGELTSVGFLYDVYDLTTAMSALNDVCTKANQYIVTNEPWVKTVDPLRRALVLRTLYKALLEITFYYLPVIPNKANEALNSLRSLEKVVLFPKITHKETIENA